MNPENLNQTQFANHVHPHQMALPGMEHLAHPFAEHLARGYMLDMGESEHEHHLAAIDVSHPLYPHKAAELSWAKRDIGPWAQRKTGKRIVPGEVTMVSNFVTSGPTAHMQTHLPDFQRARGLAGALFHTAHHFNLGQETLPIHSVQRSKAGESFSRRVRPDLRPDVWHDYQTGREEAPPGKPRWAPPEWEAVHEEFHPYQQQRAEQERAAARVEQRKTMRRRSGQGSLF